MTELEICRSSFEVENVLAVSVVWNSVLKVWLCLRGSHRKTKLSLYLLWTLNAVGVGPGAGGSLAPERGCDPIPGSFVPASRFHLEKGVTPHLRSVNLLCDDVGGSHVFGGVQQILKARFMGVIPS